MSALRLLSTITCGGAHRGAGPISSSVRLIQSSPSSVKGSEVGAVPKMSTKEVNIEVKDTRIQGGEDEGVLVSNNARVDEQAADRRDSVRSTKSREMLGRGNVARKGRVRIL